MKFGHFSANALSYYHEKFNFECEMRVKLVVSSAQVEFNQNMQIWALNCLFAQ